MISELKEAMMQKYNEGGELGRQLNGFYYQQAPQGSDFPGFPHGVFMITGSTQEEYAGGRDDNIREVDLQINIFSAADDGGDQIGNLVDAARNVFDWTSLRIQGYQNTKVQFVSLAAMGFVDEVWQATIIYAVGMVKE